MKFAILTQLGAECHAHIDATQQQIRAALASPQLTEVAIEPAQAGRWGVADAQGRKGMIWAVGADGFIGADGRKDMRWAVGCASADVPACTQWSFVGDTGLMTQLFAPRPSIAQRAAVLVHQLLLSLF